MRLYYFHFLKYNIVYIAVTKNSKVEIIILLGFFGTT